MARGEGWLAILNGRHHEAAMWVFMGIVFAHFIEHLAQGVQHWGMGWEAPVSRGFLGLWMPNAASSEFLHYFYNFSLLIGLALLWPGMTGRARTLWLVAFWLQFWHHLEHLVLISQVLLPIQFMGSAVPISLLQLVWPVPRLELHFVYNAMVFVPLTLAMYYHWAPPRSESVMTPCRCVLRRFQRRSAGWAAANDASRAH